MDNILFHIRAGDRTGFHEAYRHFHTRLYFYVLKQTRSAYLAEEIVQMTFIRIWENRASLSPDVELSAQIFRIAKSTMIDLLRKETRRAARHSSSTEPEAYEWPDPADKDQLRHVQNTIGQMAPIRQKVFRLSRLEGMSHKEIAQQLSISPKTVENHIGRALRQLKEALLFLF